MERTCCGFGHRIVLTDVESALQEALCNLIENHSATRFLTGGMGEFDERFTITVRSLRGQYPQICLCLVVPYLTKRLNDQNVRLTALYDEIILPAELDGVNKKAAISLRNRWMVGQSDFVISAVHRDFGGAYKAVTYATQRGIQVINLL